MNIVNNVQKCERTPEWLTRPNRGSFREKERQENEKEWVELIYSYYTPGVLKNKGENIKEVLSS